MLTVRTAPADTVYALYADRLAIAPDAPAAHSDRRTLTYRDLDALATAAASQLIDRGVAPGSRVGVLVERSVDLLVSLLATWKAGCAYLPLDVDHPDERIGFLLADAGVPAVLTSRGLIGRVPSGAAVPIVLDDAPARLDPARMPAPNDPAYVIYTSGSTGRPKAVEVTHGSLVNVVTELQRILAMSPADHWLTMAPPTFDISLAELCVPLASGARVTITSLTQARDAARLVRLIAERGVTRMQAVPSQWQALVDAGLRAPHLAGMTGGEALPAALATALSQRLKQIVNGYGPTEATIVSTVWTVPASMADTDTVLIGRPIANTRVYVLDDDLAEVAAGHAGELFIAGSGVARGYVGDPTLTKAAFLADPRGAPGDRMYRTGDRGRLRPGGDLEFLGRTDSQVKIRGQRVELAEVEAALGSVPAVGSVATIVRDGALIAYVVPADPRARPTSAQVRAHAARTLPAAMVPSGVVVLDAFPLTANGKIDRAALTTAAPTGSPVLDVTDPFTAEFCALVADVLGAERVGPSDDFFDIGGHSLAVMRVATAIADRWQITVASEVFYDTETMADLASAVATLRAAR
jgi:amino acid adenylation domain-containing protein